MAEPAVREPVTVTQSQDVIDLRDIVHALYRAKWILLVLAVLGGVYGLWKMRNYVPPYEAVMVVSPSQGGQMASIFGGGGRRSAAGLLQGLGFAVGGSDAATGFDRLQLLVLSHALAKRLDEKYGYLRTVFATSWDSDNKTWIRPSGQRFEWEQKIREFLHLQTWSEPTIESLAEYLSGAIQFEELQKAPFFRISVRHVDPKFALSLLKTVYAEADDLVREQDRASVDERRSYLQEQLGRATRAETRTVLIEMLSREEHSAMLLGSSLPYSAEIIEAPRVSAKPLPPSLLKFVGLPIAILLAMGVAGITLLYLLRKER